MCVGRVSGFPKPTSEIKERTSQQRGAPSGLSGIEGKDDTAHSDGSDTGTETRTGKTCGRHGPLDFVVYGCLRDLPGPRGVSRERKRGLRSGNQGCRRRRGVSGTRRKILVGLGKDSIGGSAGVHLQEKSHTRLIQKRLRLKFTRFSQHLFYKTYEKSFRSTVYFNSGFFPSTTVNYSQNDLLLLRFSLSKYPHARTVSLSLRVSGVSHVITPTVQLSFLFLFQVL